MLFARTNLAAKSWREVTREGMSEVYNRESWLRFKS